MERITKAHAIESWHFLPDNRRTQHSHELVTVGSILTVKSPIRICEHGLHASIRALDALQYAPGPIACRVRVWGDVEKQPDKLAGTNRECVAIVDAKNTLHEFACCSAEVALLLADVTDMRCWRAIEAKRAWLRKEISDQELAAARAAASDAARDAARAAASDAAWAEQNALLEKMLLEAMR